MGDILSFRLNARTKRSHYWAGLILLTVATTLLQNVSDGLYWVQMTENAWNLSQVLIILATLVVFCFGVALIVRRLHDIGRSGLWVILLLIVPVLGQIGILILGCLAVATEQTAGGRLERTRRVRRPRIRRCGRSRNLRPSKTRASLRTPNLELRKNGFSKDSKCLN